MPGRPRVESDGSSYSGRLAIAIRARRDKAKRLPADVAQEMGVALATYYRWESGEAAPRMDDLPALAKALGCSVRSLMPAE